MLWFGLFLPISLNLIKIFDQIILIIHTDCNTYTNRATHTNHLIETRLIHCAETPIVKTMRQHLQTGRWESTHVQYESHYGEWERRVAPVVYLPPYTHPWCVRPSVASAMETELVTQKRSMPIGLCPNRGFAKFECRILTTDLHLVSVSCWYFSGLVRTDFSILNQWWVCWVRC